MSGCEASEPYALQVIDNSMEPEFPESCIIIIDPVNQINQAKDGQYVFAEVGDDRWFRQYVETEDGRRFLKADNGIYPDIEIEGDFKVLGVIVQRNIKRQVKHYPV